MKNKQFSILNNGGGCSQKHLCRMHKQALAMVSAMTMLFTTSAVLPYSNFNIVGEITASAAAKTITLSDNAKNILTDSCGDHCEGHIFTQSDSNTPVQQISIGIKSGTHNVTFSGLNVQSGFIGIQSGAAMNLTLEGTNKIKDASQCGGIYVPKGAVLTIDGSSSSSLEIRASSSGAAIGGSSQFITIYGENTEGDTNCGTVEIRGGNITLSNSAGSNSTIGGAGTLYKYGDGGNITITGGKVTATKSSGFGIGGAVYGNTLKGNGGTLTISSADVLGTDTTIASNVNCCITTNPTADMISVPTDLKYTSDDMTTEIAERASLSGSETVCGKEFQVYTDGWTLNVAKVSALEYTVSYIHANKGTLSKSVYILPCEHSDLTRTKSVDSTCTTNGNIEYWHCNVCNKYFSDSNCKTETTLKDTVISAAGHDLICTERKEATCTEDGNIEYWHCDRCDSDFSDKQAKKEIFPADTVLSANGHQLSHTERKETACTENGNFEYWYCLGCGSYFSDANGETEIEQSKTVISATGHVLTYTAEINATCTEGGNIEYWYCSECDKYFSDEACKTEIKLSDTVIEAKGHNLTEIKELKPTCTENGHNNYFHCSDCDTYFRDRVHVDQPTLPEYQITDKLGHDFGEKYEYDKKSHWKTCTRCEEVEQEEHTFVDGKCSVCGLSKSYVNAQFSVSGNMNFDYSESSGNWKKDATLANDGYAWNEDTKTLTLGNIYINGDLILPYDNGLNTIVIADGANPIVSGKITFAPYQTSLTVKGNGTLTAGFDNGNVGSDNLLTITGGAEVITDFMMWSTNGGVAISDGGKLNVSEYIFTEKITMDKTAKFEIDSNVGISCYGYVENGFAGLEKYVPSGYIMKTTGSSTFIIPKDASLIFDDEAWKYNLVDKNGNSITGRVILRYNPYSDGIGEHLAGHSISLDGNIGVNFYMELDDSVIADKNAYMQFTLPNGKISKVNVSGAKTDTIDGKLYYVFSCEVAAKEMFDTIKAQIISGDKEGTVYKYSVKDYADYISDHSDYDKKTVNLVDAMLKYGEYAKSYFSKEETTDISDVEADELAKYEKQTTGNLPDGITYYGSSLLLESNTTVRHYFKVTKGTDVSGYGFKDKNGYYYTEITGISAAKLSTPQTTTIGNWNISYSPMSYVYSVLKSDSADENLVNLCKALYLYQQTATEYQNK